MLAIGVINVFQRVVKEPYTKEFILEKNPINVTLVKQHFHYWGIYSDTKELFMKEKSHILATFAEILLLKKGGPLIN